MSMDRHGRDWPGGPTPSAPYPHERMGGKFPPHEVGQHFGVTDRRLLVVADKAYEEAPGTIGVSVWAPVPDARLILALSFVHVLDDPNEGLQRFYGSTIHVASTVDFGFGEKEVEDLVGTHDVPVELVKTGLWGFQYSPTEEVEGVRADLVLGPASGSRKGKWFAFARWQALRPMTEIEWRAAAALCRLRTSGEGLHITYQVGG